MPERMIEEQSQTSQSDRQDRSYIQWHEKTGESCSSPQIVLSPVPAFLPDNHSLIVLIYILIS